ncbi:MAG TPA: YceI family protein [Kineosporiaceae bacterium]
MANTSSSAQQVDVPAPGSYPLVAARSKAAFRTRHLFGLAGVAGTVQVESGTVTLDPQASAASGVVTLSAASFDSGHAKRDGDVKGTKFLDVVRHPHFVYRPTGLSHANNSWTVTGDLTVRGVSAPVPLTVESLQTTSTGFRARATARVDRYAFGITAAKGMAARYLDLELTVEADAGR